MAAARNNYRRERQLRPPAVHHPLLASLVALSDGLQTAFREKVVRRQLRHEVADGRRRHRLRLMWWALAMVPQVGGGCELV